MKGIVFTELLEMVEDRFGYGVVDQVIEKSQLPSGGAYTAVGSYPHEELVEILRHLSRELSTPEEDLLIAYGEHLFGVFTTAYSEFFEHESSALEFMGKIENKIHPEVQKLYPDAELPSFDVEMRDSNRLVLMYHSRRKMGKFAEGLMRGCLNYFKEDAEIESEYFEDGRKVRFTITK